MCPPTNWKLPIIGALPSWKDAKRVGVDLETRDPQLTTLGPGVRRDGYPVGYGFAIEDGPSAYMPTRHGHGTNLDEGHVLQYWRDQARDFTGEIAGANLSYDLDYLAEMGIVFRRASFFRDVQVAEPLLDELQFRYSLDAIAGRRGIPGKDEGLLKQAAEAWGVHPKSGMWQLPPEYVGPYGEQDCRLPLAILRRQEREIDALGLREIWDRESRLLPVLVKMRRRGVRIDFDQLDRVAENALEREIAALSRITHLTGIQLDTSDTTKTSAIAPVLRHIGLDIPQTEAGNDSVKNDWLRTLDGDVPAAIMSARKFNKLRGTFVKSIRTHAVGDRIHCTLRQMVGEAEGSDEAGGAKFGRLSCKDPNLQQQPSRDDEIGPMWRKIYLPDEGGEWLCADYSSQEPRITVHYAEATGAPGGAEMAQRYRDDPRMDYHQQIAEIMGVARKPAKTIGLALAYNMGEGKLAKSLGLPYTAESFVNRRGETINYLKAGPEAQALLAQYHEAVPYIRQLAADTERVAKKRGYVRTWGGRHCHFPRKRSGYGYDFTHKALNRTVQGSAADQMRQAMVDADDESIPLQLQVHDELDLTIGQRSEARQLAEVMRNAMQFTVPMVVDLEVGPNWADIEKIS